MPTRPTAAEIEAKSARNRLARKSVIKAHYEKMIEEAISLSPKPQERSQRTPRNSSKALRVPEKQVLRECMAILASHPAVALWWRQNTGGAKLGGFHVKFSFKGASDLMGVLKGGRFFAIEVKASDGVMSQDQINFLQNVADAGGFAAWVNSSSELKYCLDQLTQPLGGDAT